MRGRRSTTAAALAVTGALLLAACSGNGGDGDGGDPDTESPTGGDTALPVVVGTTDTVTNIDPAGSYDKPSWNIVYNTYQRLLAVPLGETDPQPDAAESCDWEDDVTYTCTLRDGLTFSDGSPLTAENVRHSVERQLAIQHQSNGWQLLSGIEEVETPDELTVTFHLADPDATFPYILTTAAAAIVPMSYPADALQPNDQVIGSGPYTVESFDATQQIRLGVNESYAGDREVRNSGVIL